MSDNYIYGTNGRDRIEGTSIDDFIVGGAESDFIYGYAGNDVIVGDAGRDHLLGGEGNDQIYGVKGDNSLYGEQGVDLLYGGAGNDLLSGGEGADIFKFKRPTTNNQYERDIISDFDPDSGDVLWLESWNDSNLNYTLEQVGENTLITITPPFYQSKTEIVLLGVQATDLTTDDYIFNYDV